MLHQPLLHRTREPVEQGENVVRFHGKPKIRRLDEQTGGYPAALRCEPLDVLPSTNVLYHGVRVCNVEVSIGVLTQVAGVAGNVAKYIVIAFLNLPRNVEYRDADVVATQEARRKDIPVGLRPPTSSNRTWLYFVWASLINWRRGLIRFARSREPSEVGFV